MNCGSSDWKLAARITREASHQTYYTVHFLVDGQRKPCAYQAYAYFRWLDDHIDNQVLDESERIGFIGRQRVFNGRTVPGRETFIFDP